ncbi:hypothetical protein A7K73_03760 [Candidatus Methylacidiphilum fumarolicum]|uniref:Opacity protein or related surface antigen n=2 Tax=Candidatus Methylacidiphilum fumarolicum TaxID=591154 RepID=I0K081_METFB|nr:hypothetical protein A7K73_03760 [Candidatus Methylacidiphilum fumarolicum]TFE75127.1 hypothetical protein A7D33_11020 [Candidatus Methylacidiphilum fumarolicum]CCG92900.1 Opacity protein or related surface antigen [Methylacidiphilum fumariolicum SolV]
MPMTHLRAKALRLQTNLWILLVGLVAWASPLKAESGDEYTEEKPDLTAGPTNYPKNQSIEGDSSITANDPISENGFPKEKNNLEKNLKDEKALQQQAPFSLKTGLYAGVFGGGAFSAPGNYGYSLYPSPVGLATFNPRGGIVNGVGGIEVGYEFPKEAMGTSGSFYWSPSVQFDGYYMGVTAAASQLNGVAGNIAFKDNFNSGLFFVDGILKVYTPILIINFGVGIGGAYMWESSIAGIGSKGNFAGKNLFGKGIDTSSGAAAVQGIAGVERWITDRLSFIVEYRFVWIGGSNFSYAGNSTVFGSGTTINTHFDQFEANLVLGGLRYKF